MRKERCRKGETSVSACTLMVWMGEMVECPLGRESVTGKMVRFHFSDFEVKKVKNVGSDLPSHFSFSSNFLLRAATSSSFCFFSAPSLANCTWVLLFISSYPTISRGGVAYRRRASSSSTSTSFAFDLIWISNGGFRFCKRGSESRIVVEYASPSRLVQSAGSPAFSSSRLTT